MGFGFGSGNNVSYSHGSRSFGLIETTCPCLYKNTFSYSHAYRSFGWTKKLSQRHSRGGVANGEPFF